MKTFSQNNQVSPNATSLPLNSSIVREGSHRGAINRQRLRIATLILSCLILLVFSSTAIFAIAAHAQPADLDLRHEFSLESNRKYRLPIIMYHSTFKNKPGNFNVPPEQLREDFSWLKENGYQTITVADLILFQEKGELLPPKPIMLTFDDGYTNNYLYMFPLLKEFGFKCVMGIIGALTDRNYASANKESAKKPSWAHMDYEQIKALADSGMVEIQNHTYNLHHYGGSRHGLRRKKGESVEAYTKKLTDDLKKLDEKLLLHCGVKTTAVVYPYGAYSKETLPIIQRLGYKSSFTCLAGINYVTRTSSLFNLKRNNRPYGKTSAQYFESIFKK